MNEFFYGLISQLNIGSIITPPPTALSGGLSHQTWSVSTTQSRYVIKLLNPVVMARPEAPGNYRRSEELARLLSEKVNAVPAIMVNGDVLIKYAGQYCLIFEQLEGGILPGGEIRPEHCSIIGEALGLVHASNIQMPEATVTECPLFEWRNLGLSGELQEKLEKLNQQVVATWDFINQELLMSHRDLDPKNVLWRGLNAQIIDWEAAGMINPALEFWECAMNWGVTPQGDVDKERIDALVQGYKKVRSFGQITWSEIAWGGYAGMLGWLHYNLQRSNSRTIPEVERTLGHEQVLQTLNEIESYSAKSRELCEVLIPQI